MDRLAYLKAVGPRENKAQEDKVRQNLASLQNAVFGVRDLEYLKAFRFERLRDHAAYSMIAVYDQYPSFPLRLHSRLPRLPPEFGLLQQGFQRPDPVPLIIQDKIKY